VLVRYADEVLVLCTTREQAEAALARLAALLAGLGLEPKAAKTRIVHLVEGARGSTSSASTIGWCAGGPEVGASELPCSLALTQGHSTSPRPDPGDHRPEAAVGAGRGHRQGAQPLPARMAGYFRYGNSARVLGQIRNYALGRVALLLSKTGKRRRSWDWGMRQVLRSPDHLGLISLDGAVISPRPFRDGGQGAERRREERR
jgi:hypothetical protein